MKTRSDLIRLGSFVEAYVIMQSMRRALHHNRRNSMENNGDGNISVCVCAVRWQTVVVKSKTHLGDFVSFGYYNKSNFRLARKNNMKLA